MNADVPDPLLSAPNSAPVVKGPVLQQQQLKTVEVWVSEELKRTATNFYNSWHSSHDEVLVELHINSVNVKFTNAPTLKKFSSLFTAYAKKHQPPFTLQSKVQGEGSATITLPLKLFLPDIFWGIVTDLKDTQLLTIPIQSHLSELAGLYTQAFDVPFIRTELFADEDADESVVAKMEQTVADSHRSFATFLKELIKSLPRKNEYWVLVENDCTLSVNGNTLKIKGAALRALLTLALLCDKQYFTTKEFAEIYAKKKQVAETRNDFDNAMKALKGSLPNLVSEAYFGNRTVKNLRIHSKMSASGLKEAINNLA